MLNNQDFYLLEAVFNFVVPSFEIIISTRRFLALNKFEVLSFSGKLPPYPIVFKRTGLIPFSIKYVLIVSALSYDSNINAFSSPTLSVCPTICI